MNRREIHDKLSETLTKIQHFERIESQKKKCEAESLLLEKKYQEEYEKFKKEKNDVDKLLGYSWANFIQTLRGNKLTALEKEKKEMLEAKLRIEAVEEEFQALKEKISSYEKSLLEFSQVNERYQGLLKEKEKILKQENSSDLKPLFDLDEKIGNCQSQMVEVDKAKKAGEVLETRLREVEDIIGSADFWSTIDVWGGGAISSIQKNSEISEFNSKVKRLSPLISGFQREIKDVHFTDLNFKVTLDSFEYLLDVWGDNLFTDLSVDRKIERAQDKVLDASKLTKDILFKLVEAEVSLRKELQKLQEERSLLLQSLSL